LSLYILSLHKALLVRFHFSAVLQRSFVEFPDMLQTFIWTSSKWTRNGSNLGQSLPQITHYNI